MGGYATFGETGNVDNRDPNWVHGHFQTNTGTLQTLIQDVKPVLIKLLNDGVPVELSSGTRIKPGQSDAYYDQMLRTAASQHGHSGDGRSIDLFMPKGTRVPVPLTDVRHGTGREGSSGVLPGSGQSWVGHLTRDSRAGGPAPVAPAPRALPPAPTNALGPTTNRLPVPGAALSQVDLPTNNRPGVIPLQVRPFQDQVNQAGVQISETGQQVFGLGTSAVEASQGLAVLKQELTTATSPASGSVPGTATTPALPAIPAAAAGTEAVISSQQGLAAANNAAAQDIKKAGDAAKPVPQGFTGLGTVMSGAIGALGSIAMGIGGYQQMQQGGTYNTLMGLAGIFGAVGGIAGMFTPGGSLYGMFRANGGPVNARQPYIVGERGPELFLPDGGGQVLSTNDTDSLFKKTRAQLESNRNAMQQKNEMSFADFNNKPIDVRYESRVINGVEYVTTEQLRVATREAAERGKALAFQSMQGSVKTRRRLGL